MSERDLYPPIKAFLESQGYEVKGEVKECDVVAVRGDEAPVVVELKETLSFALLLQGVDRLTITESVYIAFRVGKRHSSMWRTRRRAVTALLRRLGLGLLTVSTKDKVVPVLDPKDYKPRGSAKRQGRLLKEFFERVGDPEVGGSPVGKRLTAYRQDALRCVQYVSMSGVAKVSEIRAATGVDRAGNLLLDNHYGWFERERRGYYVLSQKGTAAIDEWADALRELR